MESGLISRSARSVPYERIQDVALEESPVARLLEAHYAAWQAGTPAAGAPAESEERPGARLFRALEAQLQQEPFVRLDIEKRSCHA